MGEKRLTKEGVEALVRGERVRALRDELGSWAAANARYEQIQRYRERVKRETGAMPEWDEAKWEYELEIDRDEEPWPRHERAWWPSSEWRRPFAWKPFQPGISWVEKGKIALGDAYNRPEDLKREGITKVYDVRKEAPKEYGERLKEAGIEYVNIPVADFTAPSQKQLDEFVRGMEGDMKSGKRVLVHCQHGQGRSPTMLAAYYVAQCHSPQGAWNIITKSRVVEDIPKQRASVDLFWTRQNHKCKMEWKD